MKSTNTEINKKTLDKKTYFIYCFPHDCTQTIAFLADINLMLHMNVIIHYCNTICICYLPYQSKPVKYFTLYPHMVMLSGAREYFWTEG